MPSPPTSPTPTSFPATNLVPKKETQALRFLETFPEADGRNVVIAILDTGVDPGAGGLQVCPDGRPKLLDMQDCSGSGDVDTKATARADLSEAQPVSKSEATEEEEEEESWEASASGRKLTTLTGRTLTLGHGTKAWSCPSNRYRLGVKMAYELFPSPLLARVKRERREAWEREHTRAEAEAQRDLASFLAAHPEGKNLSRNDALKKKDLEDRVQALKTARSEYTDLGPVLDVVAYQDGERLWRVLVVPTDSPSTDLRDYKPLAPFRAERQYGTLPWGTRLNFGVNVYQDGDVVSLVTDSGAHGTHVAGIAAGYFPDAPELNGVAPGAQLISLKIGDQRLDGMETGAAVVRALTAAANAGVDLINMSFGEPTRCAAGGRVQELCRRIVLKHHVHFISSAGNTGPALSTVGSPGGSTPHLMGIGAYVDPDMMTAQYAMRNDGQLPSAHLYTWTSRGPSVDGQLGVFLSAPGGAVTSVPNWTLASKQLMNGTSMASPSAAGCVALLVSRLKAEGALHSPARVRRALALTAKTVPGDEVFAQGHGLLQLMDAYESLKPFAADFSPVLDMPFEVRFPGRMANSTSGVAHGLHLREPWECLRPSEHVVELHPLFALDEDATDVGFNVDPRLRTSKPARYQFEVRVKLDVVGTYGNECVKFPSHVLLTANPCAFKLYVSPECLPRGEAHFVEVVGYDESKSLGCGPLFRIPITLIRPEVVRGEGWTSEELLETNEELLVVPLAPRLQFEPSVRYASVPFTPGRLVRKYLVVPSGATWCDVRVTNETHSNFDGRFFAIHALQLRPNSRYREDELEAMVKLETENGASVVKSLRVYEGATLELVVGQWWSAVGSGTATIDVKFSGVTVRNSTLSLGPANGWLCGVDLVANLRDVRVDPSAEFKLVTTSLAPARHTLEPMFAETRNAGMGAFPPETRLTWELKLYYDLPSFDKSAKFKLRQSLGMNDLLYDSPLESQMTFVVDAKTKRVLGVTDYASGSGRTEFEAPAKTSSLQAITVIRLENSNGTSVLEGLKDLPLILERAASFANALAVYAKPGSALVGGGNGPNSKLGSYVLRRGQEIGVQLAPSTLPFEDWLKKVPIAKPGDVLVGSLTVCKKASTGGWGEADMPGGYPITVVVPPKSTSSSSESSKSNSASSASSGVQKKSSADSLAAGNNNGGGGEAAFATALVKARGKLLEGISNSERALFDREWALTLKTCGEIANAEKRVDLTSEVELIALRRAVKELHVKSEQVRAKNALVEADAEEEDADRTELARLAREVSARAEAIRGTLNATSMVEKRSQTTVFDLDGLATNNEATEETLTRHKTREARVAEANLAKIHAGLDEQAYASESSIFQTEAQFESQLAELGAFLDVKDVKFLQIRYRLARKHERFGTALALLEQIRSAAGEDDAAYGKLPDPTSIKTLLEEKTWLCDMLGWGHLVKRTAESAEGRLPRSLAIF